MSLGPLTNDRWGLQDKHPWGGMFYTIFQSSPAGRAAQLPTGDTLAPSLSSFLSSLPGMVSKMNYLPSNSCPESASEDSIQERTVTLSILARF